MKPQRHIARHLKAPFIAPAIVCAMAAMPIRANAATLNIDDLWISMSAARGTTSGTIEFNLRFDSFNGGPMGYDFFSTQIMVQKIVMGLQATFTLNEFSTENTALIGPDYWLPSPATGNENASTQVGGTEYRFSDFVSISQSFTPSQGDVLSHFVIDFDATSPDQLGGYRISMGVPDSNFFSDNLVNMEPNTIVPLDFMLVPEPSTGLLFLFGGGLFAWRRRRPANR